MTSATAPRAQAPAGPTRHRALLQRLTRREREVFELAVRGSSRQDIATCLDISVWTVGGHLARVYRKLGVHSCREAATLLGFAPPCDVDRFRARSAASR